jgi:serine/threonine protein kinase
MTDSKYNDKLKHALKHLKNDYSVQQTLGEGAFCKVKLAIHQATGEKVAMKIYDKKKLIEMDGEEGLQELLMEHKILAKLHNEHVVRLYEVIDTPDILYVVMELCTGGEVFDYIIAHGHLEEEDACRIFHQTLHALEYIHRHNIVHRDLKPENLLMDDHRDLKMIDFGFAGGACKCKLRHISLRSLCFFHTLFTFCAVLACSHVCVRVGVGCTLLPVVAEEWTPGVPLVRDVGSPFYVAPEVVSDGDGMIMGESLSFQKKLGSW